MKSIRKLVNRVALGLGAVLVLLIGLDVFWDTASPQTTCASCHEIESSSTAWAHSGHRLLSCRECHGTAFSNGLHGLTEKGRMVVHHFTRTGSQEIGLDETQVVEMLDNCKRCHGKEYAKWISGGHSATYAALFLNEKHNSREQPNSDCLRCHGMFFGGTIQDLMSPVSTKGPWKINQPDQAARPAIPCLTCHEIHRRGSPAVSPDYSDPKKIFYATPVDSAVVLYYYRYEKTHIEADDLPLVKVYDGKRPVDQSTDPRQRVCMQCHAPNAFHVAGSSDDRTPRGVHEGLSCLTCHDTHSNDARQSCIDCHPAISNCGRDVTKMNTTFADSKSPHNIHFVGCPDCHPAGIPKAKGG
ncbi:MAG: multiheme c-type cytochrome [Bacteroidota bacterium]